MLCHDKFNIFGYYFWDYWLDRIYLEMLFWTLETLDSGFSLLFFYNLQTKQSINLFLTLKKTSPKLNHKCKYNTLESTNRNTLTTCFMTWVILKKQVVFFPSSYQITQ